MRGNCQGKGMNKSTQINSLEIYIPSESELPGSLLLIGTTQQKTRAQVTAKDWPSAEVGWHGTLK